LKTTMRRVGFTTTIPVEIIFAAGAVPVDLNNIFITHPARREMVQKADLDGYPRNICWWIKGIYGVVLKEGIKEVIAVMQGDCSNTHALAETLMERGVRVIPFSYPYDRDKNLLRREMEHLAEALGVKSWEDIVEWKRRLDEIRRLAHEIDRLTIRLLDLRITFTLSQRATSRATQMSSKEKLWTSSSKRKDGHR